MESRCLNRRKKALVWDTKNLRTVYETRENIFSFDIRIKLIGWGERGGNFSPIIATFTFPVRLVRSIRSNYWSVSRRVATRPMCKWCSCMHGEEVTALTKISGVQSRLSRIFSARFRQKVLNMIRFWSKHEEIHFPACISLDFLSWFFHGYVQIEAFSQRSAYVTSNQFWEKGV